MWLLQNNIWKEEKYNQMISILERYNINHKVVNLIPFSETINLEDDPSNIEMVFGSIRFTELLRNAGCRTFFNDNFNYLVWVDIFRTSCLNYDGIVDNIGNRIFPLGHDVFIRPILDDKSFSGTILQAGDTLDKVQFTTSKPKNDIEILISSIKKIYSETRYFVIDGNIVTSSTYRVGSRVAYQNNDFLSPELDFAKSMIDIWKPSDMFCIDIANTPEGYKIIEFGSIHNCGFYDIDLSKLIQAIQEYFETRRTKEINGSK